MYTCGLRTTKAVLIFVALAGVFFAPTAARAQQPETIFPPPPTDAGSPPQQPSGTPPPAPKKQKDKSKLQTDPTYQTTITAIESDEPPDRDLVKWNEYQGPYITFRMGGGFLYEVVGASQDQQAKEQVPVDFAYKIRDFRVLFNGRFPSIKRSVTWSAGFMYDAPSGEWLVRQTGVMIAVPELWGHFFIGRSKEGFSLNKVMTGYDGWTMERTPMSDASIPLLADGIKWLGYLPKYGFMWNLGYFNDFLSKGQSFSSYSSQEVGRFAWLPIRSVSDTHALLHIGWNVRFGKPVDDKLQLRSRPEAFPANYFVDTGKFPATGSFMSGYEAYYRRRNWLFGSEYWWQKVDSPSTLNPVFHGGFAMMSWNITGETRTYNTQGGFFRSVSPARTVFSGGPGAWELVFNYSYIDLDGGAIRGGRFGRFTPMVNWYLSDNMRLEFAYGYGRLDRFGLTGNTQFFQSRIQLQL